MSIDIRTTDIKSVLIFFLQQYICSIYVAHTSIWKKAVLNGEYVNGNLYILHVKIVFTY